MRHSRLQDQEQIVREHMPKLLDMAKVFTGRFLTDRDNQIFVECVAAWRRDLIALLCIDRDAREQWEASLVRLAYRRFVADCLYLPEVIVAQVSLEQATGGGDHYPNHYQSAPWWAELNRLKRALKSSHQPMFRNYLEICQSEFEKLVVCVSEQEQRTLAQISFTQKQQEELEECMRERGIPAESFKEL